MPPRIAVATPSTARFKVGDWVYFEFQLGQITKMEEDRVVGVTTGYIQTGGNDMGARCKPLSVPMKVVAGEYEKASSQLHAEGSCGLNYPEIATWLVNAWLRACDHVDDNEALARDFLELREFVRAVLRKQDVDSGYGFSLFTGGRR